MKTFRKTLFVATCIYATTAANKLGTDFQGDATYYGYTSGGNCALRDPVPDVYGDKIMIALNGPQYSNSEMCGACVEGRFVGPGSGSGPFLDHFSGYISDQCPGCGKGDLDFAMDGDGKFEIEWKFVKCDGGSAPTFEFEGSNVYYWKIQPRGMESPAKKVKINDKVAKRTQDNFFVVESEEGLLDHANVEVVTILDKRYTQQVSLP
ncbi:unnamed protein product [Discosporangium mesarthrocarpum]